ncbi:MAG: helix-turn-helix transcriptional regulator [Prolixibacteraceae bacterium]|nr:helix-turn-helix transcriptional regulator [Prolixibacteraceae bacterium]
MEDQFKTTSIDELINRDIGQPGTKEREKFDAKIQTSVIACQLKELRKKQNITQQQLAEMVGIDKTQISKIEKGSRNLTIETISRIVKALGATFDLNIKMV